MAKRVVIPLILLALLAMIHAQLWFGRGGVRNVATMRAELDAQRAANTQAQLTNQRLAAEVRDLKEGQEMIEERARSELGMVKPNEIYVQIAKDPAQAASAPKP